MFPYKGTDYRSKFELEVAKQLQDKGMEFEYEKESFEYFTKVPSCECADCGSKEVYRRQWYTPDFFLANEVVIEVKGYFTAADRKKAQAMKEYHPEVNLKLLFRSNNKIHKNSDTRYGDWCDKNNIDWALKEVPQEWVT